MTDKLRDAAQQALEALERFGDHDHQCPQYPTHSEPERYPPCSCGYEAVIAALRAALAQQDAQAVPQSCQSCGKDINNGKVRCALGRNCWVGQQSSNNAATTPPAQDATWNEYVETACALIKAADDAAAAGDYMLDSNDCIKVLRGQWNAPLANDCPPRPQPTQQEAQEKNHD